MNKEQFLAMSLPYGLLIAEINDDGVISRISELYPSRYDDFATHNYYKPVLHPLSDLIKEIEHNGERFVPIDRLSCLFEFESDSICPIRMYINGCWSINITELPYDLLVYLIEWHFAIGLSDDEYIDVNTLDVNPYK